ncbi:MAG: hypothetical protein GX567_17485 [Clostridia bacterium]|nr:hypothetical protein [Clostridia bacterium]
MSFYQDEKEDAKNYKKMVRMCVLAASFVLLLFLAALYINTKPDKKAVKMKQEQSVSVSEDEIVLGESELTSDQLDFWKEYQNTDKLNDSDTSLSDQDEALVDYGSRVPDSAKKKETSDQKQDVTEDEDQTDAVSDNQAQTKHKLADGNHIKVQNDQDEEEWIEINDLIKKNTYQLESGLRNEDHFLNYYENNQLVSSKGIDVSKYNGEIDWKKVKEAGIQFAMIRVGTRGYGTGTVVLDDHYVKNIEGALANGIKVGVYFYSQATSKQEAIEEANYTVAAIMKYKITYPVACDVESTVKNDTSRTDQLSTAEITEYTKAFCDTVKSYGYLPMIYSDQPCLLKKLDLTALDEYDIWLSQPGDTTDYPYRYSIWQYSKEGHVDGINGNVDLNIGFVRFDEK